MQHLSKSTQLLPLKSVKIMKKHLHLVLPDKQAFGQTFPTLHLLFDRPFCVEKNDCSFVTAAPDPGTRFAQIFSLAQLKAPRGAEL